jgi:hypothetical protein
MNGTPGENKAVYEVQESGNRPQKNANNAIGILPGINRGVDLKDFSPSQSLSSASLPRGKGTGI